MNAAAAAASPQPGKHQLSRRRLLTLAGAGAGLLATGCSPGARLSPRSTEVDTLEGLLKGRPFYVAHRGSQDNWPEHTAEAYRQSLDAGAGAIEISVHQTADGEFICHHDANTLRMTGVDLEIKDSTYAELSALSNNAKPWLGPSSASLPLPKLTDILDQYAANTVIFVEDKAGLDPVLLLDVLDRYPDSTQHFVWKQSGTAVRQQVVKDRGYATWGYFTQEDLPRLTRRRSESFDFLGVEWEASDGDIRRVVGYGKPVICWEIHTRSERDRVARLGVRGMMCANIPYVTGDSPSAAADGFVTGIRAAGDLPYALAWTHQPVIQPRTSSIRLDHPVKASYCMGSLCPLDGEEGYSISFEMRWPETLPQDTEHAGIAFGQNSDAAYRVREPSTSGGYHFVQRMDGGLELFGRQAGEISGYTLATAATKPPVAGEWMRYEVRMTPAAVSVTRLDGGESGEVTASSTSQTYRGGYFFLCRNYDGTPAVEFRSIQAKPAT